MPGADTILYVLAFVLTVWGASLIIRALTERAEAFAARRRAERTGQPAKVFGRAASTRHARAAIALGTLCLALGIGSAWAGTYIGQLVLRGSASHSFWTLGIIALLALALAAAMTGWWFDPPRGRRRCPKCWYDLDATPGMTCPECGHTAAEESRLFRIRRKPALIWLAALLLLVTSSIPGVRRVVNGKGIGGLIPTTLLIAGFTWLPEEWILGLLKDRLETEDEWKLHILALEYISKVGMEKPTSASVLLRALSYRPYGEDLSLTPHARRVLVRALAATDLSERRAAIALFGMIPKEAAPGQQETITDDQAMRLHEDFLRSDIDVALYIPASLIIFGREAEALELLKTFDPTSITHPNRMHRVGRLWHIAAERSPRVIDVLIDRLESAAPAAQRDLINYSMTEMFERSGRLREAVERIARDSPDDLTAAQALVPLMWHEESLNDDMIDRLVHFLRTRSSSHVTAVKNITGHVRNSTLAPPVADRLAGLILDSTLDEAARAEIARFMMEYYEAEQVLPALPALRTFMQSSSTLSTDPTLSRLLAKLEYQAAAAAAARSDSPQEVLPADAPNAAEPADDAVPTSSEPPR